MVSESKWSLKRLVTRLKDKHKSALDDLLVIGIDFGTTYSGAAWATLADFGSDQINLITSWPGTGLEEGKAPTELYYEHGDTLWGYQVPPEVEPIKWFKLLLLRSADLSPEHKKSRYLNKAREFLRETEKTPTDLAADYLRLLWNHILDTIYKARGESISALKIHIVITVPAIWQSYARQSMRDAAAKAGMLSTRSAGATTLAFAPEPEAAALSTLCEPGRGLNTKDVYVICDAGGGTVDLISYEVGNLDPIQLHEATIGTGGVCGGIFIDEQFEKICRTRLGTRPWNKLSRAGINTIMKKEWEHGIKPQFSTRDPPSKEYPTLIPPEAFKGSSSDMNDASKKPVIKDGRIHFRSTDIKKAYDDVFREIDKLISEQLKAGIILVGGLGSSRYLQEYLNAKYKPKRIEVYQSSGFRPGAIFKGFLEVPIGVIDATIPSSISIVSTIARQSLGIVFNTQFEKGTHLKCDKFWDEVQEIWQARNQMSWYLEKAQTVDKMNPVSRHWVKYYHSASDYDHNISFTIYQCNDDDPPSRMIESVKPFCKASFKIEIPYKYLPDYTNESGRSFKKVDYDVEMVPSGASVEFMVLYKGQKIGSRSIDIKFE
ncbi:actin-like ATPase domain-containing protein [Xylaria cubensis]|nr:actin-like ATPase domain-containing protein [Xylaria cubensis]